MSEGEFSCYPKLIDYGLTPHRRYLLLEFMSLSVSVRSIHITRSSCVDADLSHERICSYRRCGFSFASLPYILDSTFMLRQVDSLLPAGGIFSVVFRRRPSFLCFDWCHVWT
jgi:hypothetical protein